MGYSNVIAHTALTADGQVGPVGTRNLYGWSAHETSGAAVADCLIRKGTSTAGAIVATIELAANASSSQWFGPQGIRCEGGIFFDAGAGAVEVVVYYS